MPVVPRVPFGFDSSGRLAVETNPDRIVRQDVLTLLGTNQGERVMRVEYGANLRPYVFDNLTPAEQADMTQRISGQMSRYVPQARMLALDLVVGPDGGLSPGLAEVTLNYQRIDTLAGDPQGAVSFQVGQTT